MVEATLHHDVNAKHGSNISKTSAYIKKLYLYSKLHHFSILQSRFQYREIKSFRRNESLPSFKASIMVYLIQSVPCQMRNMIEKGYLWHIVWKDWRSMQLRKARLYGVEDETPRGSLQSRKKNHWRARAWGYFQVVAEEQRKGTKWFLPVPRSLDLSSVLHINCRHYEAVLSLAGAEAGITACSVPPTFADGQYGK